MDTAVVGLSGTVVGVVGTLATTRLGGTEQRRTQNDQSARQERATAYTKLVTACSRTYRLGYAVHVAVQDTHGRAEASPGVAEASPGVAERLQEFSLAVESAREVVSLVKLHGPEEIARAADNLVSAMSGWYREVAFLAQGEGDVQWAGEAIELYEELEERFIALGREALSRTPVPA
ncbi:hypothetical protein [Streptomyces prunicolor]|uniref:hypothetical protein n=1 Tax=Streptomyces prunicolor TaxID=67348 RepID=UPI0033C593BA